MNAYIDRIRDFARHGAQRVARLTPTQRVTLLVGVALVAAVTLWWVQVERQATEVLLPDHDLSSDKRSELLKIFADAELTGASVVEGQIRVPRGKSQKYMAALPEDFLLSERVWHHRDAASRKSGLFELPSESARLHGIATVRDMENVICRIDGVEDVFIHFDERIENGLKPKRISTAAVAIVTDGKTRLSRLRIDNIRRFVVSSRAGMKLSDVMVIDVLGGWSVGGPGSEDSQMQLLEYAMQFQEKVEQHWQEKISEVLKFVPESQVVVTTPAPTVDPNQPAAVLDMQTDRQISISVSVPTSYHLRRLQNHRGSAHQTLQQVQDDTERQIRQAIHGLIRAHQAEVAVTTFDDLPETDVASNGWMAQARGRNWTAGVALLIAAAGVLLVHITSRSKPKPRLDEPAATISLADETVDLPESDSTLEGEDSELRATLTDRIQSDPDQAVRVLNQWLSRAG